MKSNWSQQTKLEWENFLTSGDYDISGTLKFYNGSTIGRNKAAKLINAYWHKVDRTLFGHAANKGYGVERWCFTEMGKNGNNLHLHFIAKSPIVVRPCCAILNALWTNMNRCTADYHHNWITPIQFKREACEYAVKDTRYLGTDTIGERTSHTNISGIRLDTFDIEAQIKRILNRVTKIQLEEAYKAMECQAKKTERRHNEKQQAKKVKALSKATFC